MAIFDSFIFNGVQTTNDNVLPTPRNSIPLSNVFDVDFLLGTISDYGIEARLVPSDWNLPTEQRVPCIGMTTLSEDEYDVAIDLLKAFRPEAIFNGIISEAREALKVRGLHTRHGVCLHHRDGQDWHDHCSRWSSIDDGIYRGNCLNETGVPFLVSLENRALTSDSHWVYYVGDHEIPQELVNSKYTVVSKEDFLRDGTKDKLLDAVFGHETKPTGSIRDVWSLVDYITCGSFDSFVGNSVSSWSAVQIALRQENHDFATYWYNGQSIPLADFLPVYQIPIVFTYTEMTEATTKYYLQASILSVKEHMPSNKLSVLYHGNEDKELLSWLRREGVIIHQHYPTWRSEMNLTPTTASKLRQVDSMSYAFEQWQRIDIPKYVDSEYCLFLDPRTLVKKRFTIADFGLDLTRSISFLQISQSPSSQSGISVMSIPHLRSTYDDFVSFALAGSSASVRSAYETFYQESMKSIPANFAFEIHEKIPRQVAARAKLMHFHEVLPHQYLGHKMGIEYGEVTDARCKQANENPHLCSSLQKFAKFLFRPSGERGLLKYCKGSFPNSMQNQDICSGVLKSLVSSVGRCTDLDFHLQEARSNARRSSWSQYTRPRESGQQTKQTSSIRAYIFNTIPAVVASVVVVLGAISCVGPQATRKQHRNPVNGRLNMWTTLNIFLTCILAHIVINMLLLQRYAINECG